MYPGTGRPRQENASPSVQSVLLVSAGRLAAASWWAGRGQGPPRLVTAVLRAGAAAAHVGLPGPTGQGRLSCPAGMAVGCR